MSLMEYSLYQKFEFSTIVLGSIYNIIINPFNEVIFPQISKENKTKLRKFIKTIKIISLKELTDFARESYNFFIRENEDENDSTLTSLRENDSYIFQDDLNEINNEEYIFYIPNQEDRKEIKLGHKRKAKENLF